LFCEIGRFLQKLFFMGLQRDPVPAALSDGKPFDGEGGEVV
jgi:hypothetical protein